MALVVAGLAWIAGLALGTAALAPGWLLGPALAALAGGLIAPRGAVLARFSLFLGLVLLGAWRAGAALEANQESALAAFRERQVELQGRIDDPPRCGANRCSFVLEVDLVVAGGVASPLQGRVQVATAARTDLSAGRTAVARGVLLAPRSTIGLPRAELLGRRGIHETLEYPWLRIGPARELPPLGRFEQLRAALERLLVERLGGSEGALAAGLLLGREVQLPAADVSALRATGTGHILAVSGFNVAVVGAGALGLAWRLVGQRMGQTLAIVVVAAYTLLVGAPPSAIRAALMFGAAGLGVLVGRQPDALLGLVLAAAAMLAVDPGLLLDVGFQLSCAATTGLVLFGSRLTPTARWLPGWVSGPIGMTLAAQLLTLPISIATFHSAALVAPLANLAIGWALTPLTALAFATLLIGAIPLPGVVALPAGLAWLLGHFVLLVVRWLAELPHAALSTGQLPVWAVAASYLLILLPWLIGRLGERFDWANRQQWRSAALVAGAVGLVAVGWLASQRSEPSGGLRLEAFDAGGDGLTLIETAGGRRLLFGSFGSTLVGPALADRLPFLDRAFDLLVVTRQSAGEGAVLASVLRRYPVALLLMPAVGAGEAELSGAGLDGSTAVAAQAGQSVPIEDGLVLEIQSVSVAVNGPAALAARLRRGQLEILVVGGGQTIASRDAAATIVRLAPELTLGGERGRGLEAVPQPVVVVGGQRRKGVSGKVAHFALGGASLVELQSNGERASLERRPCEPALVCRWPD